MLHTHSRRLDFHPHLHVVIPGGGVARTAGGRTVWRALRERYLFNGFDLAELQWLIAAHIPPKGLQRVRCFGFLHGNARRLLRLVQLVLRCPPPVPAPSG